MQTEAQRYNGWTNYATWGVALVLDNDEGTYNYVRERIEAIREEAAESSQVLAGIWTAEQAARFNAADFLKDYVEELCHLESDDGPTLMARQVIQAGLAEVDWDEIADHVLAE
jgi:hypothetical protein